MHNDIVLSIIIPIKISGFNTFIHSRLERFIKYFDSNPKIEYVIVDSTKIYKYSKSIEKNIENIENAIYLHVEIEEPYSAAKARNRGAHIASGKYLIFYDIDLIAKKDYFLEVLADIESLSKISSKAFTIYPCLYLTENYTIHLEKFLNKKDLVDLSFKLLNARNECLSGIKSKVLYPAINTSTILVNRKHFISIGGYDEDFSGHGYEDFFLIHVLSHYYSLSIKDKSYFRDDKTDYPGLYTGFRKHFSYYSLENLFKGKFTAHLYHERNKQRVYYTKRNTNSIIFQSKLQKFGTSSDNKDYITYGNYQEFINQIISKHGFRREDIRGLYRPLLSNDLNSRLYRLYRKSRKLLLNPRQFFIDIRFEKYKK
ncbi:glycosyltransferase [Psychrobacter immobilis]|uniref:glycosyltransferase n=1 Tax=Psychrobacter immobilis TaxID=498 RepID=UPI001918492E|nr:glycosyltransferase [Psychrobacter immobilis]